jgi:hypothetical protein
LLMPMVTSCIEILKFERFRADGDGHFWVDPEDHNDFAKFSQLAGWLRGYITAENIFDPNTDGDVSRGSEEFLPWIYGWCREHPSKQINDAIDALTKAMRNGQ